MFSLIGPYNDYLPYVLGRALFQPTGLNIMQLSAQYVDGNFLRVCANHTLALLTLCSTVPRFNCLNIRTT